VHHVVVMPRVSKELGQFLRKLKDPRGWLVKILTHLYSRLQDQADRYQGHRDPNNENHFFYDMNLCEGDTWYALRFSVDDHQAPGYLFVVAVGHEDESE
jgi:hypothetical protein